MAQSGSVAERWIACDIVLVNSKELWISEYGVIDESEVHRIEIVAELDTGSRHLGLQPAHIQALRLETIGDPVMISSVLDGKVHPVTMFGPVTIFFHGKNVTVEAYELKFASNPLLGLEPAQLLKIDIDWRWSKIYLPVTGYTHNAFTVAPEDVFALFGRQGEAIIKLQKEYKVSIEINNRRKVDKIVVIICTDKHRDNIQQASAAIKTICPSFMPAPEEERD